MGTQFSEPTTEAAYPHNNPNQLRPLANAHKRNSTLLTPASSNGAMPMKSHNSDIFQKRCFSIRNKLVEIDDNKIVKQDGLCCQVLWGKQISRNMAYILSVVRTEWGNIGWGIIDSQYRDHDFTAPYDPITPNLIYFDGWSGAVYGQGEGVLKKQAQGFGEGAKVTMEISWEKDEEMEIKWWVNRDFQVVHRTKRFSKKRISWVPFVKLWTIGDVVRFDEELK